MAGTIIILMIGVIYMLPSIAVIGTTHPQKVPLIIVNILLGWTFVGWVIVLAWAAWNYD